MSKSDEGHGLQPLERLPAMLAAGLGFIAVGLEVMSVFQALTAATGDENSPTHAFASYLWASLALILILGLIAAWFHFRLGIRVDELRSREAAIRLQHAMAEEVRLCAADPKTYSWVNAGSKITEFLAQRLPGVTVSITVKALNQKRLKAVFRGGSQDITQRGGSDDLDLADSHVYRSFKGFARGQKRWVYIRDTENVPAADRSYAERAKTCGFRSVIAFPLREPVKISGHSQSETGMNVAGLLGFWSLDSEEPDDFISLFRTVRFGRPTDNEGKGLHPRADIQAFYGIADCMATILMLQEQAVANGVTLKADGMRS